MVKLCPSVASRCAWQVRGQCCIYASTDSMAARIARLLCSNTFLLSLLSILGILELGRNIFDNEEALADYNINTVNKVEHITTLKLVEMIKDNHEPMIVTNKIVTKKDVVIVTNAPKITKKEVIIAKKKKTKKKYTRQKILLLAYAR